MVLILVDYIDPRRINGGEFFVIEVGIRPTDPNTEPDDLSLNGPATAKYLVSLVDVIVQMMMITFILKGKEYKKHSTYYYLFAFSTTILVHHVISLLEIPLFPLFETLKTVSSSGYKPHFLNKLWIFTWLYIDFYSYFFYLVIIFLMILNHCILSIGKSVLEVKHVLGTSVPLSLVLSIVSIEMSGIQRNLNFPSWILGTNDIYEKILSGLCYAFPVGSIICYIIIDYQQQKQSNSQVSKTSSQKIQLNHRFSFGLLITSVLYLTLLIINNFSRLMNTSYLDYKHRIFHWFWVMNSRVMNCAPELFLPIFVMLTCLKKQRQSNMCTVEPTRNTSVALQN